MNIVGLLTPSKAILGYSGPLPCKDMYSDDRRVWNAIFEAAVRDLFEAQTNGIDIGGEDGAFFPIVLGNKGDWSYLDTWWLPCKCFAVARFSILVPKKVNIFLQNTYSSTTLHKMPQDFLIVYNKLQLRYPAEI